MIEDWSGKGLSNFFKFLEQLKTRDLRIKSIKENKTNTLSGLTRAQPPRDSFFIHYQNEVDREPKILEVRANNIEDLLVLSRICKFFQENMMKTRVETHFFKKPNLVDILELAVKLPSFL